MTRQCTFTSRHPIYDFTLMRLLVLICTVCLGPQNKISDNFELKTDASVSSSNFFWRNLKSHLLVYTSVKYSYLLEFT